MKTLLSILLLFIVFDLNAQIDESFKYDTVEVIYLVSNETNQVFTIEGYQVRYLLAGSNCCGNKDYKYEILANLDNKKKKINYTVWSYKDK